jgi:hypothetical protein
MATTVTQLERLDSFRLCVRFSDGSEGIHDFASVVNAAGPMLEPLRDPAYFDQVFVESGALKWPNGFEIAPEWLHGEMENAGELTAIGTE